MTRYLNVPGIGPMEAHECMEPLVALVLERREEREREQEREANRGYAAMCIAPSLTIARALYRGRHVPREALNPEFASRLVSWDGVLTDDLVLDVLVLVDADRLAGEYEPAPAPSWTRRRAAA